MFTTNKTILSLLSLDNISHILQDGINIYVPTGKWLENLGDNKKTTTKKQA